MKAIIFWIISWIISALILFPCLFLSLLSGFKVDYHHEFHMWWWNKYLEKL
jgi:hypothetical protein